MALNMPKALTQNDINALALLVPGTIRLSSALAMFLGFFWAGWDPEMQSWHDRIAGTIVVRVPKPQALM